MSIAERALKFLAARLHVPPDALDYVLAGRHIGRPAETTLPFPRELIPIGARLVLRGWMNKQFFPVNRDWVLPYWAVKQFDPDQPAFSPAGGFNLYTINQSFRDWTMIGTLQNVREALVDPRGWVTPWFDGWSLDTWVWMNGELSVPSRMAEGKVSQVLREDLPIVRTTFRNAGVTVDCEAFAAHDDSGDAWVVQNIQVKNTTRESLAPVLCLSIRPFNPEGVSLVKKIEYREEEVEEETLGTTKPAGTAAFLVNDALGVILPTPDAVACSDYARGDVALDLPNFSGVQSVECAAGLGTAVAGYHLELGAGASSRLSVLMPMERRTQLAASGQSSAQFTFPKPDLLFDKTVSEWQGKLAEGMQVRLPDERMQAAFDANKAFLLLFHDGNTITPGPLTYHQFWLRDAAYMLNALDKLGYHPEARQVLETIPRRVEKDGYVSATEGEWDSNGAALWAISENARLSGDLEFVARNYWTILRMAAWIHSKRHASQSKPAGADSVHAGLLPPGPSAEHLGPSDYYYWDDFWGLAGLREAARIAGWVGQEKDRAKLAMNFDSFRAAVDASLSAASSRNHRLAMPAAPGRRLDAGMIANLAALYPLRLFAPDDPRILDTLAALYEKACVKGHYFNHVGHSAYGTYLALHMAECYLFARKPEAWPILQWMLDHASPTWTWAEGLHPTSLRGGMGDGHHGWAAADFLLAVRNALIMEEDNHLVITPALKREWTVDGSVIKVEKAATYFGNVDMAIAFGERTGTLALTGDWRTSPEYVEWDLGLEPLAAEADAGSATIVGHAVRLPKGARRVVVTW